MASQSSSPTSPISPDGYNVDAEALLAVELSQLAIWRRDLGADHLQFNSHAMAISGLPARAAMVPIAVVSQRIHPDDLHLFRASMRDVPPNDLPTDVQARWRHEDGGWRWLITRRTVHRDAQGKPLAHVGVALDVTAQVEQTQRAEATTRRFEAVTRTAGIGHWLRDASETSTSTGKATTHWSDTLRDIYGLPRSAPAPGIRAWLDTFVHVDDREEMGKRVTLWLSGAQANLTMAHRIVRPDGGVRHILSHARRDEQSGSPQSLVTYGVVIDLTEQRQAEMALQSVAQRAAFAAHGIGMGTWEIDIQTGNATWDEQMWRLRGLQPRPGMLDEAQRLACVHPDDRALFNRELYLAQEPGKPLEREFRVVWPDGSVRWLATRSSELICGTISGANGANGANGQRRRVGVNWDITDKHIAQAARQAREVAQRESQAKSQFMARMSHELRTPLNAVLGFSQLLVADASMPVQHHRNLQHIHGAGQHLLSLVDDALDLSSLQSGEMPVQAQPVPLADLVADTLPLIEPMVQGRPVHVHCGSLAGTALADGLRLRQVLLNLLTHAIQCSPDGTRVDIETLDLAPSPWVALRVCDSAATLNDAQRQQGFEPFARWSPGGGKNGSARSDASSGANGDASAGASGKPQGTGIGLAIVKALVEHMGGRVQVLAPTQPPATTPTHKSQRAPGIGNVFELVLPAAPDTTDTADTANSQGPAQPRVGAANVTALAESDEAARTDAGPARRHQLLYIEDNPVNALIVSELLSRRPGIQLHLAEDGASGVALAAQLLPDLVLIDMQLPDMDGLQVLQTLRAKPATAQLRCVALSANAMPEDMQRARDAGMVDYWTKPLDFKAFLLALDRVFGPAAGSGG
jgi:signal transduction histidine kinase/ActR/RegA family two-component response regulator